MPPPPNSPVRVEGDLREHAETRLFQTTPKTVAKSLPLAHALMSELQVTALHCASRRPRTENLGGIR